jgi:CAAX protease family protein
VGDSDAVRASSLSAWLRALPEWGERALIIAICFGPIILSSSLAFLRGRHSLVRTDARTASLLAVEMFSTSAALLILKVRGGRSLFGKMRVSIPATSRGALLWIGLLFLWMSSATLARVCGLKLTPANTFRFLQRESWAVGIPFLLLNSYFEERFVAGYLVESLERHGPAMAVAVSVAVRFLYHTYQGWLDVVAILPMGILFGVEYWRKRNLYPLMVAHTAMNLMVFLRAR